MVARTRGWGLRLIAPCAAHPPHAGPRRNWEGIYVLYTYAAMRKTARTIQLLLSNPEAGAEDTLLRHITFNRS
jgi:hypothetical protein